MSGARKLKTVGMPSWRRAREACLSAGWKVGAKQKVMPTSSATRATAAGGRSMATPSSSRTSAAPVEEEAARPPCLTTLAPAAAATMAAMVEMLTVFARSPPVPTRSTVSPGILIAEVPASRPSARPATSAMVSPLARRATAKAAIWASVAVPDMIWDMAQAAWPEVRASRSRSVVSRVAQVVVPVM